MRAQVKQFMELLMYSDSFEDYIHFLRSHFGNLVEYIESKGSAEKIFIDNLITVEKELFDKDPFVVFGATVKASQAFAEQDLYH